MSVPTSAHYLITTAVSLLAGRVRRRLGRGTPGRRGGGRWSEEAKLGLFPAIRTGTAARRLKYITPICRLALLARHGGSIVALLRSERWLEV
jgi:hypothetical protein